MKESSGKGKHRVEEKDVNSIFYLPQSKNLLIDRLIIFFIPKNIQWVYHSPFHYQRCDSKDFSNVL